MTYRSMIAFAATACAIAAAAACGADPAAEAVNPWAKRLADEGVPILDGAVYKFETPRDWAKLTPAEKATVVAKAAEKSSPARFAANKPDAPIRLDIAPILDATKTRRAQRLRIAFLAYGDPERFKTLDAKLLVPGAGKNEPLTAAELAERKLVPAKTDVLEEFYAKSVTTIDDNFQLTGITRTQKYQSTDRLLVAVAYDPAFADDREFPARWRYLKRGKPLEPPFPYTGLGGWVQAVRHELTADERTALKLGPTDERYFVEGEFLFSEPTKWYGLNDYLRSKIPIAVEEAVKSLRTKLQP